MKRISTSINAKTGEKIVTEEDVPAEEALEYERERMVCSRLQARTALYTAGLLASVEKAVSSSSTMIQLAWEDATEFRRNSPSITMLAEEVGISEEELDNLFRAAMRVEA